MKLDKVSTDDSGISDIRGRRRAGGFPMGTGGKVGIPGLIIAVIVFFVAQSGGGGGGGAGGDITDVLGQLGGGQAPASQELPEAPGGAKDAQYTFVSQVKNLLDDHWREQFAASGDDFREAGMVIFDAPTNTGGCGVGSPEAGPFYCPGDDKIYLDFGFYSKLEQQLGFEGDFAMAYVIAHEYGHHVQNVLGINEEVRRRSEGASEADANAYSVKLELQADCFAGVWGHSAFEGGLLSAGDLEEALGAASAVGDDSIQERTQGGVDQESFTHGSAADRQRWFTAGYESGDASRCDTFS